MRLNRGVPILAAALTLAGSATPAYALVQPAGGGGPTAQPTPIVQHHSGDSTD